MQNPEIFPRQLCDQLFAAVLVHDDLYPDATLPPEIHLNYSTEQLTRCYQICLQLWIDGTNRQALQRILDHIGLGVELSAQEQLEFKHMRAKFKHLRFAFMTFDRSHQYPRLFHYLTGEMGKLQDALKNKQAAALRRAKLTLRLLLSVFPYACMTHGLRQFQVSSIASFRAHLLSDIDFVRTHLQQNKITSKDFHEMRKVISRQVALYDNLKTLYPSDYHEAISQCLSTLNGMMGSRHDDLIIDKFKSQQDYYQNEIEIPSEIRQRLQQLVSRYPLPDQSKLAST